MPLTRERLVRFVKTRNKSGFQSNFQFYLDASHCGFDAADLGDATKIAEGHYEWQTPFGRLVEINGCLMLKDEVTN